MTVHDPEDREGENAFKYSKNWTECSSQKKKNTHKTNNPLAYGLGLCLMMIPKADSSYLRHLLSSKHGEDSVHPGGSIPPTGDNSALKAGFSWNV